MLASGKDKALWSANPFPFYPENTERLHFCFACSGMRPYKWVIVNGVWIKVIQASHHQPGPTQNFPGDSQGFLSFFPQDLMQRIFHRMLSSLNTRAIGSKEPGSLNLYLEGHLVNIQLEYDVRNIPYCVEIQSFWGCLSLKLAHLPSRASSLTSWSLSFLIWILHWVLIMIKIYDISGCLGGSMS